MKKILLILIPLMLLLAGCTEEESNGATGQAIAAKQTQFNYPVELKNYVSGLGNGKFVLTSTELAYLKTGEKIFIEIDKRNKIPQYGFGYELTLPKALSVGESVKANFFHEEVTATFSSSNMATVNGIQLKNFNSYKGITVGKFNIELIKKDMQLTGIKVYNTQQIEKDEVTQLYNV